MLSSSWRRLPVEWVPQEGAEAEIWVLLRQWGCVCEQKALDSVCSYLGLAHLSPSLWLLRGFLVWTLAPWGLSGAPNLLGVPHSAQLRPQQAAQKPGTPGSNPLISEKEPETYREKSFTGFSPNLVSRR